MVRPLLILCLLSVAGPGAPARLAASSVPAAAVAGDPVVQDMRQLLDLAFNDAESAAAADPAQACPVMEHHWRVFGGMIQEYGTRSGDRTFKLRLSDDLQRYCGHGLDAPLPSDGD